MGTTTATTGPVKLLAFLFRTLGICGLAAVFPLFMPLSWMAATHRWLGLGEMPNGPIVEYLARSVSAFYVLVGIVCLVVASDLERYRPLARLLAVGFSAKGLIFVGVDLSAALPWWWSACEGPPLVVLGLVILFLARSIPIRPG